MDVSYELLISLYIRFEEITMSPNLQPFVFKSIELHLQIGQNLSTV